MSNLPLKFKVCASGTLLVEKVVSVGDNSLGSVLKKAQSEVNRTLTDHITKKGSGRGGRDLKESEDEELEDDDSEGDDKEGNGQSPSTRKRLKV